ncbi:acyl-CoA N-acyltransferase [Imleria badia]|nr:acyl-CoA N-acyltransferase [Imleria badia]
MANNDWTVDSNEALVLSLVRAQEDRQGLGDSESFEEFYPTFTYPIYGEDEKIYGYQDLVIDFRFASGSLAQFLSVRYAGKLPASSTVDDVEGVLSSFIPLGYETEEEAFLARVEKDATSFQPIGKCIHSYTRPAPSSSSEESNVEYEVYHATFEDSGFREYHRRMQIFILLYIEAGSYINEEEDGWEFVVLSRKRRDGTATYHFVGYSSLYNFYCFPEKVRLRLSQFVILPPYQRQGHGSELYTAIYNFVVSRPDVSELTVEDPAEAFEDLRDRNDLRMLLANEQFMKEGFEAQSVTASHGGGRVQKARPRLRAVPQSGSGGTTGRGKMGPPVDRAWSERRRKDLKIAGRQFHRLVEMLIMLHLDPTDVQSARAFRLQVKERLYRFNFEILAQMEKEERLQKLEETFQSVLEDYKRLLAMV